MIHIFQNLLKNELEVGRTYISHIKAKGTCIDENL